MVCIELCSDAQKNTIHGRLGFSGSKWTVLLAMRRSSSVLLLGPSGRGVARLVEAGLLAVAASRRSTGSGYTATGAACVSSTRTGEFDELQLERTRLIGP